MTQQRDDAKPIKVLAAFADYEGLVRAIRERRSALGLSQLALDDLAGLPSGYTAKIEAMLTNPGAKNARAIGRESLPLLLGALGIELAVVPGAARHRRQAEEPQGVDAIADVKKTLSERGRKGWLRQRSRMTEKQYRRHQQKAARIRWRKWREQKARKAVKRRTGRKDTVSE
mgnify:CR=1 FL=1